MCSMDEGQEPKTYTRACSFVYLIGSTVLVLYPYDELAVKYLVHRTGMRQQYTRMYRV